MRGSRQGIRDGWTALVVVTIAVAAGLAWQSFRRPWVVVPPLPASDAGSDLPRVLIFTRTMKYRHRSIPAGVRALHELGNGRWLVDHTEDPSVFTDERLRNYRAVVFLSTTGNVLDEAQQQAFQRYIEGGGGFVGVHAASDTEYDWPWFGALVGAWFRDHTAVIEADVHREDASDASTRMLPDVWRRTDEWYAFRSNPRPRVKVLARMNDGQMGASAMGGDHPIAWKHRIGAGRSWYTGMGHTIESFSEPLLLDHLRGGLEWAAGLEPR
jgi:type 1 glutamine amidotransferase